MAARSKARTVCNRSNSGIVGSNPTRRKDVSAFFCVVLSYVGRGLATGRSSVQGDLPNVQNRLISFRSQTLNW
jgi:hypothetical protein